MFTSFGASYYGLFFKLNLIGLELYSWLHKIYLRNAIALALILLRALIGQKVFIY